MIADSRGLTSFLLLVCLLCGAVSAGEGDWSNWRGPMGNGHASEAGVPEYWDANSIVWCAELPGDGQSSPVIAGDRIFLTSALEAGKQRLVFCINRLTGAILWKETAWTGEPEPSHAMNGWASATCATDGERVVAFFGRAGMHCYDINGKHLWSQELGKFQGPWGTGASPLIVDNLVIQNCDAEVEATITALNKHTGEIVWKTPRDIPTRGGWSSPVLINAGPRRELVLNGFNAVTSYDPATGKKLWFCKSFAGRGEPTATFDRGLLYLVNGGGGDVYAVKPGGEGDVTEAQMAWHTPRRAGRDQPSPIVIGDMVIVVSMDGVGCAYDATTGRELWKDRFNGKFTSSPIAANGLAYFQSITGETVIVEPDAQQLSVVTRNTLPAAPDEIFRASLTPSHGQMFSRSNKVLYCLKSSKNSN